MIVLRSLSGRGCVGTPRDEDAVACDEGEDPRVRMGLSIRRDGVGVKDPMVQYEDADETGLSNKRGGNLKYRQASAV
jgi:hypothetical protein